MRKTQYMLLNYDRSESMSLLDWGILHASDSVHVQYRGCCCVLRHLFLLTLAFITLLLVSVDKTHSDFFTNNLFLQKKNCAKDMKKLSYCALQYKAHFIHYCALNFGLYTNTTQVCVPGFLLCLF